MTKLQIDIAIEKNRIALLRLVIFFLRLALCMRAQQHRALPRRVNHWIVTLICKMETAAYHLKSATLRMPYNAHAHLAFSKDQMTIGGVIARLSALKKALTDMRALVQRSAAPKMKTPHRLRQEHGSIKAEPINSAHFAPP